MPIVGTTKVAHVEENLAALDITVTAEEMRPLDDGFAKLSIESASSGPSQLAAIYDGAKTGSSSVSGHGMSPLPN